MSSQHSHSLLVIHGGGPTAVLNCSLYGIIQESRESPHIDTALGARYGVTGVLNSDFIELGDCPDHKIDALKRSPGSAIGSSRHKIQPSHYDQFIDVLGDHDIRYLLFNGGNGTMYGASLVAEAAHDRDYDVNIIGVPKTVDNDLTETDRSPGYASAARYIATSVRELGMDVGTLPTPVSILETMGRDVGWLAAASAAARTGPDSAPHLIYLPEKSFAEEAFLSSLDNVLSKLGWAVVVVSEGLRNANGDPIYVTDAGANTDAVGRMLPGGVASHLADVAARALDVRCRSEKPGLCARASLCHTSPVDRKDAQHVGREAVRAAVNGASNRMVALLPRDNATDPPRSELVPLRRAARGQKVLPQDFISQKGHDVTPAFSDYLNPLLGPELTEYIRFV